MEKQQLPSLICAFICEGINILKRANHCIYPLLNKFLLSRPAIDLTDVPMYYTLFNSGTPTYRIERMWILKILSCGDRSRQDLKLLSRRHVLSTMIALFDSPSSDHVTRPVILKVFRRVSLLTGSLNALFRCGFISWLPTLAMKDKMQYLSYSVNVWSILMEQIEELLVNGMDTGCDEDIGNSPSSIDPYAEKVNDLPDDIHSEDFQLLQVNMDYAITKTLLQIVTQSGDQNFQRVFQKM